MVLENYGFCNYFEELVLYDHVTTPQTEIDNIPPCTLKTNDFPENFTHIQNVCENFKKLYFVLLENESYQYINLRAQFINYWLNKELSTLKPPVTAESFFSKMKSSHDSFDVLNKLEGKIHTIHPNDLENMKDLYELYIIYNKIQEIIKDTTATGQTCSYYSKECVRIYKKLMKRASESDNSTFHAALDYFKNKYEQMSKSNSVHTCEFEKLPQMPSKEEDKKLPKIPSNEENKELPRKTFNNKEQEPPRKTFGKKEKESSPKTFHEKNEMLPSKPSRRKDDKLPSKPFRAEIDKFNSKSCNEEVYKFPTIPSYDDIEYEFPDDTNEVYTVDKMAVLKAFLLAIFIPWVYNKTTAKNMSESLPQVQEVLYLFARPRNEHYDTYRSAY
ncbi:PIR Superfamily Protein [Plasmodium ovale curtisi]|uniref:PIR Superfamily Protein n=1 Tax=Plasmodium ovale curtisi TaxID=864141 RepID=A0A1A8WLS7_PLAOA|nr:PIR Superfamily Protein [Plasmodium ovale curtisi]SBS99729.1 PIR Superfamily Protein [Plasmodium ovale curtisi]